MFKTKTSLIRAVMYLHGKQRVFTNKYDTCRTVKCYAGFYTSPQQARNLDMADDIQKYAAMHGFTVSVKLHNNAIIARIDSDNDIK